MVVDGEKSTISSNIMFFIDSYNRPAMFHKTYIVYVVSICQLYNYHLMLSWLTLDMHYIIKIICHPTVHMSIRVTAVQMTSKTIKYRLLR